MEDARDSLSFYARPAGMTALPAPEPLPARIEDMFAIAAGVMIHRFWGRAYGETFTPEREAQAQTRSAREMIAAIKAIDVAPLHTPRPPSQRFVGVCRHFTVLTAALLRAQRIPARARCGFATYFGDQRVDHWVVEYWDGARWKLGDSQLDAVQLEAIKADFDPLDVPRDRFLVAGDAWNLCREGGDDPDRYGIMDMHGLWFVAGNVVRDLAALNNAEMLPWDVWGLMTEPGESMPPETLARLDRAAALCSAPDDNLPALRALHAEPGFRLPGAVMNVQTGRLEPSGAPA